MGRVWRRERGRMILIPQYRTARKAATAASAIASVFAGGAYGCWYDYSDDALVWQDAARSTPAANGDPIGGVTDKSGNAVHGSQSTSGKRPTRTSGAMLGDGSDDFIESVLSFAATPYLYVFAVTTTAASPNGRVVVMCGTSTNDYQQTATGVVIYYASGSVVDSYRNNVALGNKTISGSTKYLVESHFDATNHSMSLNGGTASTAVSTGNFNCNRLLESAGYGNSYGDICGNAKMHELVVIIGTALTAPQITAISDELRARHGL